MKKKADTPLEGAIVQEKGGTQLPYSHALGIVDQLSGKKHKDPEVREHLGESMKLLRDLAGMTLAQAEQETQVGMATISRMENGNLVPARETIEGVARGYLCGGLDWMTAFQCSLDPHAQRRVEQELSYTPPLWSGSPETWTDFLDLVKSTTGATATSATPKLKVSHAIVSALETKASPVPLMLLGELMQHYLEYTHETLHMHIRGKIIKILAYVDEQLEQGQREGKRVERKERAPSICLSESEKKELGEFFKAKRESRRMRQIHVPVGSFSAISRMEKGTIGLGEEKWAELCAFFDVLPDILIQKGITPEMVAAAKERIPQQAPQEKTKQPLVLRTSQGIYDEIEQILRDCAEEDDAAYRRTHYDELCVQRLYRYVAEAMNMHTVDDRITAKLDIAMDLCLGMHTENELLKALALECTSLARDLLRYTSPLVQQKIIHLRLTIFSQYKLGREQQGEHYMYSAEGICLRFLYEISRRFLERTK